MLDPVRINNPEILLEQYNKKYPVPIPTNLPLILGQSLSDSQRAAIEAVLKNPQDLSGNLALLGTFWKVKVWFNKEVELRRWPKKIRLESNDCWSRHYFQYRVKTLQHTFNYLTRTLNGSLVYCLQKTSRKGYFFPDLSTIIKYEPIPRRRGRYD